MADQAGFPRTGREVALRTPITEEQVRSLKVGDVVLISGYDGGTDLSGGQWQRVALARALCAIETGAGLVLLDEPTAQLDVRGEAEIFDRILSAARNCTTIVISPGSLVTRSSI